MILKSFSIGGLCLRLVSDEPILDVEFYTLFRTDDNAPADLTVRVLRQPLPKETGRQTLSTPHRRRFLAGGAAYDYTCFPDAARRTHVPYACAVRQGADMTLYVDYNAAFWDTMIFDALGLPDVFLEHSSAVVHAAFVGIGNGGVLFAGPKQTGKTTQSHLWRDFAGAVVINDDRALIREEGEGFTACGVPFCGSSRICLNEQRPLNAVVFPVKSDNNTIVPLTAFQSFQRLIGCFSYTETDPAAKERAVLFAERVATGCRCFLLNCCPDADAVRTLRNELELL